MPTTDATEIARTPEYLAMVAHEEALTSAWLEELAGADDPEDRTLAAELLGTVAA